MASINLIDSFAEFKDAEDIDRPTLIKVIEDVLKHSSEKNIILTKTLMSSSMTKQVTLKFFNDVKLLMMRIL